TALSGAGYSVESTRVVDEPTLRAALERSWDLVLCDAPPGLELEAVRAAVEQHDPGLPFIACPAAASEAAAVSALRAGVHDYVPKSALPALGDAVARARRRADAVPAARRRHQAQQRASEARYRLLFELSPLPKWVFDLESLRFIEVNAAAVASYGYS